MFCISLGFVAEMELDSIKARTRDGLQRSKLEGKKLDNQGLLQKNESDSIVNQQKILKDVVEKEQLENLIYFVDDGITGTSLSYRPAISKAVELVEAGKVKNFIVKDLSRLARNYLDSGKLIEIIFPENEVRFIAVSDGFDSSKQSDNDANLLPLWNIFNEWYARDTSKKIRAVKQAKAKARERMTTNVIYGYKRDTKNRKIGSLILKQQKL